MATLADLLRQREQSDAINATPQNAFGPLSNAVTGGIEWLRSPLRTQQMQGLGALLESTGIPKTLERISYGEPLTNINQANVPLMKPETAEAIMNVAPFAGAIAKGARLLPKDLPIGMSIKEVSSFKYPQEEALKLAQQRAALPVEKGGLGLATDNTAAQRAAAMKFEPRGFHETEGANIENSLLNFDVNRVGAAASDEQTPYAMFIKPHGENIGIARKNPSQMPLMVKSNLNDENILQAFGNREELQSYLNQFPEIKQATKAVRDLDHKMANYMGEIEKKADDLYAQGKTAEADKLLDSLNFNSNLMKEFDKKTNELAAISKEKVTDLFKSQGIGTVGLTNDKGAFGRNVLTEMVLNPAENVRSRFAAFDPWRRTAATAAAMGVAAPDLLAEELRKRK